ncbi:organ-specific protein P4-like [Vitis riparia]|uniref:organ-specific protein P4-like n=1 Tax=Vitis riparia TaxID=96939 RepID=UPI00155A07C4|nr:organ-specific protein P4-like [Vitis riparia]
MASSLAFFTIFSLLLVGNAIGGRKEPGVYWRDVMKDEPMPKAIQGLLPEDQSSSLLSKKPNCQTMPGARNGGDIVKGFEPKKEKVFWVYDDEDAKLTKEKSFVKDLEPRTNVSAYHDKVATKEEKEKPFVGDFEPRPNVSAYNE